MTNKRPGMIGHNEYWRLQRSLDLLVVRIAKLLRKWLQDFSKNKSNWGNDSKKASLPSSECLQKKSLERQEHPYSGGVPVVAFTGPPHSKTASLSVQHVMASPTRDGMILSRPAAAR
jgi:hypothetical protein